MQLKKSTFLTVLSLATSLAAEAQIIHTDIEPDTLVAATGTMQMASYFINLDNNGSHEFEFRHFNPTPGPGNEATELHGEVIGSQEVMVTASNHALVRSAGNEISATSGTWGLDQYGILNAPWYGSADRYFGFRFKISGQWHYAWARLNLPADRLSFTVKEYAYNSVPNMGIEAGQIEEEEVNTTGIRKSHKDPSSAPDMYPNPFNSSAALRLNSEVPNAQLGIYNSLGEKVRTTEHISGKTIAIEREDLPSGIYTYCLSQDNTRISTGRFIVCD